MSPGAARTERIAAQLQRSLATLLQRGVKDPRVGKVTVTAVRLAPDLSVAQVHVLPFGGLQSGSHSDPQSQAARELIAGLQSAAGFLRGQLARELKLRQAPRLEFEIDQQLLQAHRLTDLIERAVASDADKGRGSDG